MEIRGNVGHFDTRHISVRQYLFRYRILKETVMPNPYAFGQKDYSTLDRRRQMIDESDEE